MPLLPPNDRSVSLATSVLLAALLIHFTSQPLWSDEWPNWRGPTANGVAPPGTYPTTWNRETNIRWRTPLPGKGGSTPAVAGDHVFVTCEDGEQNALVALDRAGKILWTTHVGTLTAARHAKASGCNPSPATNGRNIFVYFKSGDLACVDFQGQIVWQTNLQERFAKDTLWFDLGTSPILTDNLVIVACIQHGPSYLAAFAQDTGELVWKQDRLLTELDESSQSYATPVLGGTSGEPMLFVTGADHVTAHDARDGREVWRVGELNPEQDRLFRSIASSVLAGSQLLVPYARGSTLTAIRLGGQGNVTDSHVAWVRDDVEIDVPTPAVADDKVYLCSDKGHVSCLEAATGKTLWEQQLPKSRSTYSASPILAGNSLYLTREDGTTFVVDIAKSGELVAENTLGEDTVSTPVFVDGTILQRTAESLFCIEAPS